MPNSFNGIGTIYFGKREEDSDGSYVTTEWVSFLYCPLFPLGSYRVRPSGKTDSTYLIVYWSTTEHYFVHRVPLNLRHIRNVYLGLYGWMVMLYPPVWDILFSFMHFFTTLGT